jgi:uncharacterized peroxidase-related enzyme
VTFIRTVPPAEATGAVRKMYDEVHADLGYVSNWAQAYSLRPEVRYGWAALISSIRGNLSTRRYELVTLAAARALGSSYCALAHGKILASQVFDVPTVTSIVQSSGGTALEPAEVAMMQYVEKIVRRADQITEKEIAGLRSHGFTDEEIFDIAAAAAARCFFSKLLDALGVEPDASFNDLDPALREALTVGRPVAAR